MAKWLASILAMVVAGIIVYCITQKPPIFFTEKPSYDFEMDVQAWGEHPKNKVLIPGNSVESYCENQNPKARSGNCSLKFTPLEIINNNAYVTVREDVQDSIITLYIFVPIGAKTCISTGCSTAKIIVWDKDYKSYESEYVELFPGKWLPIQWDLRGKQWPGPWKEFGVHFYIPYEYKGPFYMDEITIKK